MSKPTPGLEQTPAKRPRRSRAELRELMLTAGKDVLFEIEPSLGFEALTYTSVFAHLKDNYDQKVTIGSVHERIWKSQRDFQLEVLAAALEDVVTGSSDLTLEHARQAIGQLPTSTPAERRYALRTAIRLNSIHVLARPDEEALELAHMVRFRLWALGPDHPEAAGFAETMSELRRAATDSYSDIVRAIMDATGLRVRGDAGEPDEVITAIALLGNAATLGLRTDVLPEASAPRQLPTGPQGELEEWHPDALALWSFTATMLELDGDDLSADERRL